MTPSLSNRALNRATLARQHLLERSADLTPLAMIEHLAGMQSQAPLAPYVGLWSRLQDFDPVALGELVEQRRVVRLHLMRNTVHLVSARDSLDWSPLFEVLRAAQFGSRFGRRVVGVDRDALRRAARRLLAQGPHTRAELRAGLARRWPDADPDALTQAVTHLVVSCQLPPRGLWGVKGPATWALLHDYLDQPARPGNLESLVLRYLAAFGPASVADVQRWSGLTRLREVVQRLPVETLTGPEGQSLYDLPEAPRPDPDTPAPVRFLPEYDNVLLSHADRARIIPDRRSLPLPPGDGARTGSILVDGTWQGMWRFDDTSLHVDPFERLPRAEHAAVEAEARSFARFLSPDADVEIVVVRSAS